MDLREITSPRQAETLCDRIEATGALADARAPALEIVGHAKRELAGMDLSEGQRTALDLVADSVVDRHA
jgi:hypothetical protein